MEDAVSNFELRGKHGFLIFFFFFFVQVSNAVGDAVGNFELRGKYGFSLKGYFKGKTLAVSFFESIECVL